MCEGVFQVSITLRGKGSPANREGESAWPLPTLSQLCLCFLQMLYHSLSRQWLTQATDSLWVEKVISGG